MAHNASLPVMMHMSARAVALAMLEARFATDSTSPGRDGSVRNGSAPLDTSTAASGLLNFQHDAVVRLRGIIAHRRGAILADSVGLGKSHVAAALVLSFLMESRRVLICGPASLAVHWNRVLRRCRGWTWMSHTSLSRGLPQANASGLRGLIVIDEAHALRNPRTRRYRNAARLALHDDLLLLTATPVNNSLHDFHHLVRLFARNDDFIDIGVSDLLGATEAAAAGNDTLLLRRVAEHVVVRRTRSFVEQEFGSVLSTRAGKALRFPGQEPIRNVRYDFEGTWPGFAAAVEDALTRLHFPVHALDGGAAPAELMRLGLLKRLESSSAALAASLSAHITLLQQFHQAANDGYLLKAADRQPRFRDGTQSRQLVLSPMLLGAWPAHLDRNEWLERADEDLRRLQTLRAQVSDRGDPKLERLRRLLRLELGDESVLLFTEFRDTAQWLWRALAPLGGVAMIHGGEARLGRSLSTRRAVIERFAPVANGARPPRPHERVRVLIATDVLAEGLNLQDARVVVSYDLPWNPVRLAQRVGRIDRLGSPHDAVVAYAFLPDTHLERLLGLVRRIRRKLRGIRIVGGDAPLLDVGTQGGRRTQSAAGPGVGTDAEWELLERLRSAHRKGKGEARANGRAGTCVLGTLGWSHSRRGALCCVVEPGRTPLLVLVQQGAAPAMHPLAADQLLLRCLNEDEVSRVPSREAADESWAAAAARKALAAVREHRRWRAAPGGEDAPHRRLPGPRPGKRAAAAVRRWLRLQPGEATAEDCARADAILHMLSRPLPTWIELRIGEVLGRNDSLEEQVRRLSELAAGPATGRSMETVERRCRLRVLAILDLLPAGAVLLSRAGTDAAAAG
jgi:superfamily II DNA or RNA helicase